MGASAVPALLDWLTPFLKLNLENNSVDVSEGWPGDKITRTTLVIGDVFMEHEQTHLGGHRRSEDAVVECWILVDKPGGTATEVRTEAYRILDVVDTNIRTSDSALRGGGTTCVLTVKPLTWMPGLGDQSRNGILRFDLISKKARI